MIRRLFLIICAFTLLACAQAPIRRLPVADDMPAKPAGADSNVPPGDFVSFYPCAAALTISPINLDLYRIECSVSSGEKPHEGYFTLARTDDGKTALFVITEKGPVTNLAKVISFGGQPDRSLDWGFLFDRNSDGWVDYFVYLDGALPVKTEAIAGLIPKKTGAKHGDPIRIESKEELKLIIMNTRLVFTHHADDNFDGKSDGVVEALWDLENPLWRYGNGVMRSRAFTQMVDEDWRFITDIGTRAGAIPRTPQGFDVSFFRDQRPLETSTKLLDIINEGIRACRIPKGALPRN